MIYPYKQGSNSAKLLAAKLSLKQIKHQNSSFKGRENRLIINWGASSVPDEVKKCTIINEPAAVALASNKLDFFNAVKGVVNIPEFTTDKAVAMGWMEDGKVVVVREKLTGHSAEGLVILEGSDDWNNYSHNRAKMYVLYVRKKEEYRIHVVGDEVIDSRRKALRSDFSSNDANWKVRNHSNGFIFAKDGFEVPPQVLEQSILAVKAANLDFGAVDVIWNNFQEKAYVLEINTAPGLEGSSVDNYAKAFEKFYKQASPKSAYLKSKKARKSVELVDILFENSSPHPHDPYWDEVANASATASVAATYNAAAYEEDGEF